MDLEQVLVNVKRLEEVMVNVANVVYEESRQVKYVERKFFRLYSLLDWTTLIFEW